MVKILWQKKDMQLIDLMIKSADNFSTANNEEVFNLARALLA